MKRTYYVATLLILAVFLVIGASSCRKSAFPTHTYNATSFSGKYKGSKRAAFGRESYRGAGYRYDPTTYRTSRTKSKAYRPYKSVKAEPSKYRRRR